MRIWIVLLAAVLLCGCQRIERGADALEDKVEDRVDAIRGQTEPASAIGKEKAQSIALAHAGLNADEVTGLRVTLDEDWEYEVEFRQGDYKYDYTIDAVNGQILSWEKEHR